MCMAEGKWTIGTYFVLYFDVLSLFVYSFNFTQNCYPVRYERLGVIGFYIHWPFTPSSEFCALKE